MSDLKPCPFCGDEAEVIEREYDNGGIDFVAWCSACPSELDDFKTRENAIDTWNTRPREIEWHPVSEEPDPKVSELWVWCIDRPLRLVIDGNDIWRKRWKFTDTTGHVGKKYVSWETIQLNQQFTHWTSKIPGP